MIQFWLLSQKTSPSGCLVDQLSDPTGRLIGLSIAIGSGFFILLLRTLTSSLSLLGGIVILQPDAILDIHNLHLLKLLLEERELRVVVAAAVVVGTLYHWALVLPLVLVQIVHVRCAVGGVYYDGLLQVRGTILG